MILTDLSLPNIKSSTAVANRYHSPDEIVFFQYTLTQLLVRLNLEFEQKDDLRESTKLFSPISLHSRATCLRWAAAISKITYLVKHNFIF